MLLLTCLCCSWPSLYGAASPSTPSYTLCYCWHVSVVAGLLYMGRLHHRPRPGGDHRHRHPHSSCSSDALVLLLVLRWMVSIILRTTLCPLASILSRGVQFWSLKNNYTTHITTTHPWTEQQSRCHELSLQRIKLATTSHELANGQSARRVGVAMRTWSRSQCSRDPTWVNLSFFVPTSLLQISNRLYSYRQLAVQIVVSAIAVFRLVDNISSSSLQIVHWPNYKLKLACKLKPWHRGFDGV